MRPLRDLIPRALPANEPGPVEPVAVLSAIGRVSCLFDAGEVFDRALFGLSASDVRELGPVLPHVCEVAFEALEQSGLRFDRLRSLRAATYLGVSEPEWVTVRDASFLADLVGMPGPATAVLEAGAGLLVAIHVASEAIRSGDIDVALVAGDAGAGVGAAVLCRERGPLGTGKVRAVLRSSAVSRVTDELVPSTIAARRAAVDPKSMHRVPEPGFAGLLQAILAARADAAAFAVEDAGESAGVALVVAAGRAPLEGPAPDARILGLAARTEPALRALAAETALRIASDGDLRALAIEASARPAHEHRLAIPVHSREDARARLAAFHAGDAGSAQFPISGYAVEAPVAFLVPPVGAQFARMTAGLYAREPVYRAALDRMDRALRGALPRSLIELIFAADGDEALVDEPIVANPATFAVGFALGELLKSRGVVPGAVLGCGVGEMAAAAIAGAVDPEDAVRVAAERGRLLASVARRAGRLVLGASEADAREWIDGIADVDVMAVLAPERVVIGGGVAGVEKVAERAGAARVRARRATGPPNHTPLVVPILPDFARIAGRLGFESPEIGWVSATTGRRTEHADGAYWASTLRGTVRFGSGVETLYALGCRSYVELARPMLAPLGERALTAQSSWWFSLLSRTDEEAHLERVLASLWVLGTNVERCVDDGAGLVVRPPPGGAELPSYPWDRRPLDHEDEDRLVGELRRPRAPADGEWIPDLEDADDLAERQTADSMELGPLAPIHELGDGRGTPVSQERAWTAGASASTIVPLEERDAQHTERLSRSTPPNRAPSRPPEVAVAVIEVQLTPEPLPHTDPEVRAAEQPREPDADGVIEWEEGWVEDPIEVEPAMAPSTWLILTDRDGLGDYVANLLAAAGQRVVRGVVGTPVRADDDEVVAVADPSSVAGWREVIARAAGEGPVSVVHLWSLAPAEDELVRTAPGGAPTSAAWVAAAALACALHSRDATSRLYLVTRGAFRPRDRTIAAVSGALWGLGQALMAEMPAVFGGVVEFEPDDEDPDLLAGHLLAMSARRPAGRPEHVFRAGQRWRRTMEPTSRLPAVAGIDTDGAWILGGDLDAAALELAGALASRGVKRVLFLSGVAPEPDVLRGVLDLQRDGLACVMMRADPLDERDVAQLVARVAREPRICGVVHRIAARHTSLVELVEAPARAHWQQVMAMSALLWSFAPNGQRWLWGEGRSLDGSASAGAPAVAGEAIAAVGRVPDPDARGISTVLHADPGRLLDSEQVIGVLLRVGPLGGIHGVGRAR